jgi:hypothetical protein
MKPCSAKEGKYTRVQGGLERMEAFSSPQNGIVSVRAELRQHCGDTRQRMRRARLCHSLQAMDGRGLVREGRGRGRVSGQGPAIHDPCEGGRQDASCKVEAGRSAMVGRRGAQTHGGARRRPVSKGKMEGNGKTARDGRSLYLDKAAGEPRHGALPDGAAPNPIGGRLGWKLERAPVSPGRILFYKY